MATYTMATLEEGGCQYCQKGLAFSGSEKSKKNYRGLFGVPTVVQINMAT